MNNLKPHKTLRTISYKQANKKRTKVIALMILVIVLLSNSFTTTVYAKNTELTFGDWIDTSYYQTTYDHSGWTNLRKEAFDVTYNLIRRYNNYTKYNSGENNIVNIVNALQSDALNKGMFNNDNKDAGEEISKGWAMIGNYILTLDVLARTYCASGPGIPVHDNRETKVTSNDYTDLINKVENTQNNITNWITLAKKYYTQAKYDATNSGKLFADSIFSLSTSYWNALGQILKTMGTGSSSTSNFLGISWTTTSMKNIANSISGITKAFAYCIAIILFGLNVSSTMLQLEVTTPKGIIKVLAGLLIGKVWIDVSIDICAYILNIVNSLNRQILSALWNDITKLQLNSTFNYNPKVSNSMFDYIGAIIRYFDEIIWKLPEYALGIIVIISILSVIVKLVVRNFELTALMCIAPLAFATIVNNETKTYFKKFIGAFISTAMYATFMVICFAVGSVWLAELKSTSGVSFTSNLVRLIPKAIIIVGICRVMRKPPKVLTSIIE